MANKGAPKKGNSRKGKAAPGPPSDPAPTTWPRRLGQEMAALLLLGLALFIFLTLWSYSVQDPQWLVDTWRAAGVRNLGGKGGALVGGYLVWGLGLAAFWAPLLFLGLAWQSHRQGLEDLGWPQTLGALGMLLAAAGLLSLG